MPFKILEQNILEQIVSLMSTIGFNSHIYSNQTPLFYEGQTPILAYLLLQGKIILKKNKKIKQSLSPGSLLGLTQVMHHQNCDYEAWALKNSQVIFLDKTTIKNLFHNSNSKFHSIIKNLL